MTSGSEPSAVTVGEIIAYGAALFHIDVDDIMRDCRPRPVCRARFALYAGLYLRAELQGRSPSKAQIGRWLQRDHTTVMKGLERADYIMQRDSVFLDAVCRIATATAADIGIKKGLYNPGLPVLEQAPQQPRRSPMDHPEYTEARINEALAAAGVSNVEVYWNGDVIERDSPAVFAVYVYGDDTPFLVADDGREFALEERVSGYQYAYRGGARTYETLAALLASELENEIEAAASAREDA